MEFENRFAVAAPIDEVWDTLLDVERVAPCVPGAEVLEQSGDDAYKVGIKVKVGPVSMQYHGDVEIVERDAEARRAVMSAKARETRGQGTASARVEMQLVEEGSETQGTIATDMRLSGKAASMGRGVIQDVSTRLVDTFAENLATMLSEASPPPPQPADRELDVLPIVGSVAKRRLRDPRVVAGLLGLLAFFLLRRRHRR